MRHWPYVAASYVLAAGVLVAYWRWVERGIRDEIRRAAATARRR